MIALRRANWALHHVMLLSLSRVVEHLRLLGLEGVHWDLVLSDEKRRVTLAPCTHVELVMATARVLVHEGRL